MVHPGNFACARESVDASCTSNVKKTHQSGGEAHASHIGEIIFFRTGQHRCRDELAMRVMQPGARGLPRLHLTGKGFAWH
eukprot:1161204-Pelagomonas_calceolata.AAC.4